MDPDACLRRIADADSQDEISEACKDLYNWIKFGGFQPDWKAQPNATKRYRARLKKGDIW